MKNFPHQINQLDKLHVALRVFSELQDNASNLADDSTVGTAMVLAGVYAFRGRNGKHLPVKEALQREKEKPRSSRGSETFARDLRRFFILLRFLRYGPDGILELSGLAMKLLEYEWDSPQAAMIWRTALRSLVLVDEQGRASHPYELLLYLAEARPELDPPRYALALEAADDSEEERERVLALADEPNAQLMWEKTGASQHMIRNAIKILPALARQLGDIAGRDDSASQSLDRKVGSHARAGTESGNFGLAVHRITKADEIASAPMPGRYQGIEYIDPVVSAHLRLQRWQNHNEIVRVVAGGLEAAGFILREFPYDLLAVKRRYPSVLLEAKSLDGSFADEVHQVRDALGQLLYYDTLEVPADWREHGLFRVAAFDKRPSEAHIAFLASHAVLTLWVVDSQIRCGILSFEHFESIGLRPIVE